MPAIAIKRPRQSRQPDELNSVKKVVVHPHGVPHSPQAGMGACKLCACKKFVREGRLSLHQQEAHQPVSCGDCGHDIRQHA